MKRFCVKSAIVLVLAAFGLVFAACSDEIAQEVEPQAELLSLTVTTAVGTAKEKDVTVQYIPKAISMEDWEDEEHYEVAGADFGTIMVKDNSDTEEVRFRATVSPGARVTWGKARVDIRPGEFTSLYGGDRSFDTDNFLYFKVTAEDGLTSNYYRFYSRISSPVKELAGLNISGRQSEKDPMDWQPAETMDTLTSALKSANIGFYARVDITMGEAESASVNPLPQEENATFRYAMARALASADTLETPWQTSNKLTLNDGNIVYVEVTPQNEEPPYFYAFRVMTGRIATIAVLKLDGKEVVGKGTPQSVWLNVTKGSYAVADQLADGFTIQIQTEDPKAEYEYVACPAGAGLIPSSGWKSAGPIRVENGRHLAIRVRPPRDLPPVADGVKDTGDMRFYRVQVDMLAGNFRQEPKSAAYYIKEHTLVPRTVDVSDTLSEERITVDTPGTLTIAKADGTVITSLDPLTFTLDRTGSFTYQWYESNSWYGGYGFDREGRIFGDPNYGDETPGLTQAQKDTLGTGLKWDEKFNVSLHNGGNQYYRLTVPGRKIDGATGVTYTPEIKPKDRPFLTGFTNSTHYYWVVVTNTANQYKVTSARAAIVVEWGGKWNHGGPVEPDEDEVLPTALEKKHHIVDLHAYNTPGAVGLQASPKNIIPFKAGNHGDKYAIPITFPTGFDIMDYSVVMCQAKFYLADGREWIQNWTQGDFGFERSGTLQVLWYNLTNDNATRGLEKTGNDPQGGSLSANPTHVIVQPAGTKPLNRVPPFSGSKDELGRDIPSSNNDAQGWFTPYIEIVELRFEGPTRKVAPAP